MGAQTSKNDDVFIQSHDDKHPKQAKYSHWKMDVIVDRLQNFHRRHHRSEFSPVRLQNIFAKPLQISSSYEPPVRPKSEDDKDFLLRYMREAIIFAGLDNDELDDMVNAMEMFKVPAGTTIVNQGDEGDYFYLIEEGTVEIWIDGQSVGNAGTRCHFGALALLFNCPRPATCIAEQDCKLWRIDQENFRKILAGRRRRIENEKLETLRKVDFLKDMGEDDLRQFADVLTEAQYKEGDMIIEKGEDVKKFFIVSKGNVMTTHIVLNESIYTDQEFGPGEYFGDRAIFKQNGAIGNVIAISECSLLCMSKDHFLEMFGGYKDLIDKMRNKYRLLGVPIISNANFSSKDIDRLSSLLMPVTFHERQLIAIVGQVVQPAIFFILSGKISIARNRQTKIHGYGEYFGDESFAKGKYFQIDSTIEALEETHCLMLTLNSIQLVLRSSSKLITGQKIDHLPDPGLTLKNLKKHRLLGTGTFGDVWLVSDKRELESTTYALKILSKRRLIKRDQQKNVVEEKNITAKLCHPFIQTLVNAFQDDSSLYLVMELYQGGELFNVIDRRNGLPDRQAKFYAACILEAINYMHHRHVIHRDLKPENVLIDSDGYCVVVDLGFSKVVMNKTYTMCGTPLYIAPEIIFQRGYNKSADIWSFGIIIYEMLEGRTPFHRKGIDQTKLLTSICKCNYEFTKKLNIDAMDLISELLVRRVADRLGCLAGGDAAIRKQVWFQSIDFKKLEEKKLTAPWVPTIKNPLDCSNFDDWSKSKEKHEDEMPLNKLEQNYFTDFDSSF